MTRTYTSETRYHYPYRGYVIFICPSEFAASGHPDWRADRATPLTWGYRIDRIPGRSGIQRGEDFPNKDAAAATAELTIDRWLDHDIPFQPIC